MRGFRVRYFFLALGIAVGLSSSSEAMPPQVDSLYREWQKMQASPQSVTPAEQIALLRDLGEAINFHSPDSSFFFYRKALELSVAHELKKEEGFLRNQIGYTHYILAEYNQALPYFMDALAILQTEDDASGIAQSLNYISLIYETQAEYKRAIEYQHKSIDYAKVASDSNRLAANYYNLSIIYDDMAQYDSALHFLDLSQSISRKLGDHHLYLMAVNRKGEVYFHRGDYFQAERLYKQVLQSKVYEDNWETCFAYAGLAQTYLKMKLYAQSIEAGLKGLAIAEQMRAQWESVRLAEILYQAYAAQENYEEALNMHIRFKALSDSVFSEAKEKEINFLHLRQREIEKKRLENENQLQQAEIEQNNLWVGMFAIGAILMIIWGVVLYRNNRQKMILNARLVENNKNIVERNAKIEYQNDQLNKLNDTKNQLLSIIGHDMRSPINNIKTILGIIKTGHLSEDDQQKIFNELHRTVSAVADTMENMLTWASSQLNGIKITPTRIDLTEAIESQLLFIRLASDQKEITIEHEKNDNCFVQADINHLKTIIRNILGNAVKFTKRGGKVTVRCGQLGDRVMLQVEDNGVGIPMEKLDYLFVFKGKSQSLGTNNERGTGIGLMMCKDFIESNGGKIEVKSQVGKGSVFTVWLPAAERVPETAVL